MKRVNWRKRGATIVANCGGLFLVWVGVAGLVRGEWLLTVIALVAGATVVAASAAMQEAFADELEAMLDDWDRMERARRVAPREVRDERVG